MFFNLSILLQNSSLLAPQLWFIRFHHRRIFHCVCRSLFYCWWAFTYFLCSVAQSQSCLTLCYPMGCSLPGSSVHGIFQTRILGWVAIPFSKVSSQPQDQTWVSCVSCIDKWILFTTEPAGKPWLRPQLLLLGNTTLWRPMEPSGKNHQHWWGSREMLAALTHRASRVCLCASNLIQ